jgi:hypothetical protein
MGAKLPLAEKTLGGFAMPRPPQPANDGRAFFHPPRDGRRTGLCPPFCGTLKRNHGIVPTTRHIARSREAQT